MTVLDRMDAVLTRMSIVLKDMALLTQAEPASTPRPTLDVEDCYDEATSRARRLAISSYTKASWAVYKAEQAFRMRQVEKLRRRRLSKAATLRLAEDLSPYNADHVFYCLTL